MSGEPKTEGSGGEPDLAVRAATLHSTGLRRAIDARDLESYRMRDWVLEAQTEVSERLNAIDKTEAELEGRRVVLEEQMRSLKDAADRLNKRALEVEAQAAALNMPPAPPPVIPELQPPPPVATMTTSTTGDTSGPASPDPVITTTTADAADTDRPPPADPHELDDTRPMGKPPEVAPSS